MKGCSSYWNRRARNSAKRSNTWAKDKELLVAMMERRKIMQRDAPEEFQKRIFQEINTLEERLPEEEIGVLGKKHSPERMCKDRRYAKMEEGRAKLAAAGEVAGTAGSHLELRKWRLNVSLLKWRIKKRRWEPWKNLNFGRYGGELMACQDGWRKGEACC